MIRNAVFIFIALFIYKITVNCSRYFQVVKFSKMYMDWLANKGDSLTKYRARIIRLLTCAGVEDSYFPTAQPLGLGQIATYKTSVYKNFPSRYQDQAITMIKSFDEAIGIYRDRIFESFSPLYWINLIIFLPKNILSYLGIKPENVFVKIFQVIWWFSGLTFGIFKNEIINYVKTIIIPKFF